MSTDEEKKPVVEDVTTNTVASSAATSTTSSGSNKRQYLEVNKAETMKKLLIKPCETKPVKPSETLARVREFLPLLRESTNKLVEESKQNPAAVDIENVDEEDEHIEMDLALIPDDSDEDSDEDEEDDEEEEDEEEEETDDSDDEEDVKTQETLKELGLGFQVKNPDRIKRLKLEVKPSAAAKKTSNNNHKNPLISEISNGDDKQQQDNCQNNKKSELKDE